MEVNEPIYVCLDEATECRDCNLILIEDSYLKENGTYYFVIYLNSVVFKWITLQDEATSRRTEVLLGTNKKTTIESCNIK